MKKLTMHAFPNAKFLIDRIGLGQAIMQVVAEYNHLYFVKNPRRTQSAGIRSRMVKEKTMVVCRNMSITPDKGIMGNLLYDLYENTFKGQISGSDWRIDETQIKFRDLPTSVALSYVGNTVDRVCNLDHLKTRIIIEHKQKNNKGYREYLVLDEPQKYDIINGEWKNG